jgi:hypothetical protein
VSYAWEPIAAIDPERPNSLPLNNLLASQLADSI